MDQRTIDQMTRFNNVISFAQAHAADFPTGKPSGDNIAELMDIVALLTQLGISQDASAGAGKGATTTKSGLLAAVRADLVGLSRVAHALDEEYPALRDHFELPTNARDSSLLNAAGAVLTQLKVPIEGPKLVALFIDYGMPDDFVTDLEADVAAVAQADAQQTAHDQAHGGDTRAIDTQVSRGIKAVDKLDAYAQNRFRDNADTLGDWKRASHLEIRRVHPKVKPPTP